MKLFTAEREEKMKEEVTSSLGIHEETALGAFCGLL